MNPPPDDTSASGSGPALVQLIVIAALTLMVPISLRLMHGRSADATSRVPYLPVFPGHRSQPFRAGRIPELQHMNPGPC